MKKISFVVCFFFVFNWLYSQQINKTIEYETGKHMLLGKVTKEGFKHSDFSWFEENYNSYLTNDKIISKLKNKLNDYTIKVFFGSWCGDSKKNLPIFYKVLDEANFSMKNLEVIAVDKKKEAYKQSPNHEEIGLNIHRVPTFIFYKEGKEVNRIVEHPKETFERDILNIIDSKKYHPHYKAVTFLEDLFKKTSIDSIKLMEKDLIKYFTEVSEGTKELNTYGNVKWRTNDLEKAQYVFEINSKMHPYNHYTFKTLGDFYFEQKQYNKALANYYKSLSLFSNNKEIKERIIEIELLTTKQ